MSGYSLWELEIKELIRDFTENALSGESTAALLEGLGLGEIHITSSPMSAEKMLMVYSSTDYAFTSDDLTWISAAGNVISGLVDSELRIYAVELNCDEEEYYISCAAIVKLFNVVYPGNNLFIFKLENAIALGSARSFGSFPNNSFCVSGLITAYNTQLFADFLDELSYAGPSELPDVIVDGQQRLTTITILAKAIYDCLPAAYKSSSSGIRFYIENMLFYRVNAADDFKDSHIRIQHSKIDQDDYNRVIGSQLLNDESIDLDTINDGSSNILRCYKYYCEKLDGRGDEALKELFNCLFDENRKVIVLITLRQGDVNEQTIFDTINRAGIRLSTADIIKNNLFKSILDKCQENTDDRKTAISVYNRYWEDVFYKNQADSELWDKERIFGNVKHNNLEFLLYCVACIKWGENDDMFSKLESVFDRETEQMGFAELIELVKDISEYARIFKKYVLDFEMTLADEQESVYFRYDDRVHGLLLILQKFGIQMFYPYVIMRLKEVNQNETDPQLLDDFRILESFIVRRKLSPKGTHDYTSKCYEIIKSGITALVKSDLANASAGLTDSDIRRYLLHTKDDAAKMVLFWIELKKRSAPTYDINALEYIYTLEHVMPRKWKAKWSGVPINNGEETYAIDSEEGRLFRDEMIQAIGNKTLLRGSLNSAVKNEDFITKIKGKGDNKPGYEVPAALELTRELIKQSKSDPVWDEKHIADRTNRLYKYFVEIWPSFSDLITTPESIDNEDPDIDQYSEEELSDAGLLVERI